MTRNMEQPQVTSERIEKRRQADAMLLEMLGLEELPNQRMSAQEQRDYGVKIVRGDEAAKQEYLLRRLRFAMMIAISAEANQPESSSFTVEDHFQNVIEAMKTRMDEFNPKKDGNFAKYMGWSFRLADREYKETAEIVRLPSHILDKLSKLEKLEHKAKKFPSKNEAALALGLSQDEITQLYQIRENQEQCLLSAEEVEELIDPEPSLVEHVGNQIIRDKLQTALAKLPGREQEVLRLRFGLGDEDKSMTLYEVGDYFCLSHEGVRKIQRRALYKLGQLFDLKELYDVVGLMDDVSYFGDSR